MDCPTLGRELICITEDIYEYLFKFIRVNGQDSGALRNLEDEVLFFVSKDGAQFVGYVFQSKSDIVMCDIERLFS
jgi:hypothetical protein